MLDLEHLDALDDDAPPEPDLLGVRGRVGKMRTRRRWTAVATGVVVLAGAVAVAVAVGQHDHTVRVAGPTSPAPTTTPTTIEKPAASGTLPNGVRIALTLDTPTVTLGDDIEATVVLHNDTREVKTLGVDPIQCAIDVYPMLRDASGTVVVNGQNGTPCVDVGVGLAAGGVRTIGVTVPTSSLVIPPAQRDERYSLSLEKPGWSLASVPVDVVQPAGITARLEVPQTSYPSDYSLEGTLVVVNGTGRPVDYHIDCQRSEPWKVELSKDGVAFDVPVTAIACPRDSGRTAQLTPGANRLPFYVVLGYPSCGQLADGPASPACTGVPPGIPDLAPGRYQLVFRGTGAPFDAIDVVPIDIDVTARGSAPSTPLTEKLPTIGAVDGSAAQDEFARLYGMEFAPYHDRLQTLGVDVVDYGPSGNQLLIHIKRSPNDGVERDTILSLFAHPEIVTVEPA